MTLGPIFPADISVAEIADVLRILAQHEFLASVGMAIYVDGDKNPALTPGLVQKRRAAYVAARISLLFQTLTDHEEEFRDFIAGVQAARAAAASSRKTGTA